MLQQIGKFTEFYPAQVADERWSWIIRSMAKQNFTSITQRARRLAWILLFIPSVAFTNTLGANDFQTCVDNLRTEAVEKNLSPTAINAILDSAERLPRVVAADRKQAEFIESFGTYYGKRVTTSRIEQGREYLTIAKGPIRTS